MKGLLKGLKYISRIFENEKEPEMEIGIPTDVKHVAHIGWEGPSATTPSWMDDYKSTTTESKGSSNKKPEERQRNKGRRKTSTSTSNSPSESPIRVGGTTKPSKRSTGKKQRERSIGSGLDLHEKSDQIARSKKSKQKKSKQLTSGGGSELASTIQPERSKETDIAVKAVYPIESLGSSTGR